MEQQPEAQRQKISPWHEKINTKVTAALAISTLAVAAAAEVIGIPASAHAETNATTCAAMATAPPKKLKIVNDPTSKKYRGLSFSLLDISACNSQGTRSVSYSLTARIYPASDYQLMGRRGSIRTNQGKNVRDDVMSALDCRNIPNKNFGAMFLPRIKATWKSKSGQSTSKVYPANGSHKGEKNVCKN